MTPSRRILLALAAVVVATGALLVLRSGPAEPSGPDGTRALVPPPAALLPVAGPAGQAPGVVGGPPPPTSAAEEGDRAVARARNLQHPASSRILDDLGRYSEEELDLRARIARSTGRSPRPAVDQLLALRRAGATRTELLAFTDRELSSSPALQATVREWIARTD
jgi:hypothetical protein